MTKSESTYRMRIASTCLFEPSDRPEHKIMSMKVQCVKSLDEDVLTPGTELTFCSMEYSIQQPILAITYVYGSEFDCTGTYDKVTNTFTGSILPSY